MLRNDLVWTHVEKNWKTVFLSCEDNRELAVVTIHYLLNGIIDKIEKQINIVRNDWGDSADWNVGKC